MHDASDALYLLCLGRTECLHDFVGSGIDGHGDTEIVAAGEVAAVVCRVRRAEFCGSEAERSMSDLAWIGPRVCRHEAIVEAAMRVSPVVPTRFGVLFSSPERLLSWLSSHAATIALTLERFAGHEEWSIKGTLDRPKAGKSVQVARQAVRSSTSPGTRYLQQRRRVASQGHQPDSWPAACCQRILHRLTAEAAEFRERPAGSGLEGQQPEVLFNWAFLVGSSRVADFQRSVLELSSAHAKDGIALTSSGPWPPYSFCPRFEGDRTE